MNKIKIAFNKKYISKDEIAELGLDNTHADILEHDFNPKEPVNSAFFNQILLILGNLGIGVITNIIADELVNLINKVRKNAKSQRMYLIDSTGKKERMNQSIILLGNNGEVLNLIFETDKELNEVQLNNLKEILNHLGEGHYYLFLKADGKIKIFTELEYAHYQYDNL